MENKTICYHGKGQTAVEYLLLLAIVVIVVLIGFTRYLPRAREASEIFYNRMGTGIAGNINPCGDGDCDPDFESSAKCPVDC